MTHYNSIEATKKGHSILILSKKPAYIIWKYGTRFFESLEEPDLSEFCSLACDFPLTVHVGDRLDTECSASRATAGKNTVCFCRKRKLVLWPDLCSVWCMSFQTMLLSEE